MNLEQTRLRQEGGKDRLSREDALSSVAVRGGAVRRLHCERRTSPLPGSRDSLALGRAYEVRPGGARTRPPASFCHAQRPSCFRHSLRKSARSRASDHEQHGVGRGPLRQEIYNHIYIYIYIFICNYELIILLISRLIYL